MLDAWFVGFRRGFCRRQEPDLEVSEGVVAV